MRSQSEFESAVLVLTVRVLCSIFPVVCTWPVLFFFENVEIVSGRRALFTGTSVVKRVLDAALPQRGDSMNPGGASGNRSSLSIGAFIHFDADDASLFGRPLFDTVLRSTCDDNVDVPEPSKFAQLWSVLCFTILRFKKTDILPRSGLY